MSYLKKFISSSLQVWQQFWFAPQDLINLSLFRLIIGFHLFTMYFSRIFDIKTFYFNEGMIPASLVTDYYPPYLRPQFFMFLSNDYMNLSAHIIFLILLLLLGAGVLGRKATWLVFIIHLSFVQRNPTILYGADLVATFWLFYLSFTDNNRYLNLYKLFKGGGETLTEASTPSVDLFSSVFIRLLQLQLCVIYAYTGLEKLKGQTWWDGSAVWYIMGNEMLVPFDLSFFKSIPWAIALLTFSTLIFEIYFPFAVWQKKVRGPWLFIGLVFHSCTALFMGLYFFAFTMMPAYLLFVDSSYLRRLLLRFRMRRI